MDGVTEGFRQRLVLQHGANHLPDVSGPPKGGPRAHPALPGVSGDRTPNGVAVSIPTWPTRSGTPGGSQVQVQVQVEQVVVEPDQHPARRAACGLVRVADRRASSASYGRSTIDNHGLRTVGPRPEGIPCPRTTVLIASPLEPALVERVASAVPEVEVLFEPDAAAGPALPLRARRHHARPRRGAGAAAGRSCSPRPRSASTSTGATRPRWRPPPRGCAGCRRPAPASAASSQRTGLDRTDITFTTAAGVHAVPLAEFALTGVLHVAKGVPHLRAQQAAHRWERYATSSVRGRRAVVVGLGSIGRETVRLLDAVGPRRRRCRPARADLRRPRRAPRRRHRRARRRCSATPTSSCSPAPLTEETPRPAEPGPASTRCPRGAIVVNVARGQVLDEAALTDALVVGPPRRRRARRLRGRAAARRVAAVGPGERARLTALGLDPAAGERGPRRPVRRQPAPLPRRGARCATATTRRRATER